MTMTNTTIQDFELPSTGGKTFKLSEHLGKNLVIYFYPKDETPGCTAQACSIRDNFEDLKQMGIDVLGVSKDDVKSHAKFVDNHELPFDILADTDHTMIEAYGAWQERSMYGRKFFGTQRSAVVVGPKLTIEAVWPKIQPLKTVAEVKAWLQSRNG